MAERTPLQARPGRHSGRISPEGWVPPDGEYVWCLGSDAPGYRAVVVPGDEVVVSQSGDYLPSRMLVARARLRGAATPAPVGWGWEAYAEVEGTEVWSRVLTPGLLVDVLDLGASTRVGVEPATFSFGLRVTGPGGADAEEVEVPAFYVDALVLSPASAGLGVYNRVPSAGQVGVLHDSHVSFDANYFSLLPPLAPLSATTDVYVDGVLAFSGGTGQNGFVASLSTPIVATTRFDLEPPADFTSKQVVEVRVVNASLGYDASYTFTAADTEGPVLLSALATGLREVRLTFDEAVVSPVPGDFALTRLTVPAVEVSVASATLSPSPDVVVLGLSDDASPGATYRVVAVAEDTSGNFSVAPTDRADFTAYRPPRPAGRRFDLLRLMPEAVRLADVTSDLANFFACLQDVFDLLLADVDRWPRIFDLERAPENFLDALLQQLGNPFSFELTALEKRRLLRVLVEVYRRKGTAPGIVDVVRLFVGVEVEVVGLNDDSEVWLLGFDELGEDTVLGPSALYDLYSFEVVAPRALTVTERERIAAVVEYMKPAHTHHVRTVEPVVPEVVDHVELGLSELGLTFYLH